MTKGRIAATLIPVLSLLGAAGCHSCRPGCVPDGDCTARYAFPRWGLFHKNPPPAPAPPPVASPLPPGAVLQPPAQPNPAPADFRGYASPQPDATWHPPADSNRSAAPAPAAPESPRDALRLLPPEPPPATSPEPPRVSPAEGSSPPPAVSEERSRASALPGGIPRFAAVRDRVTAGLKPSLDGGLDWLRDNGYRAVLHVRAPGEDDTADRREVEKRGLKYLSLEVSPQTLSKAMAEEFNRVVGDKANYPLFVYDKDGTLAGGLWYLNFRMVDRDTDQTARDRAGLLGLKEDGEGNHRAVWLAIQKVLESLEK